MVRREGTIVDEIKSARRSGVVRCGIVESGHGDLVGLAKGFGLNGDEHACRPISPAAARELVTSILHKDLAYGVELMPAARARELAERFLGQFGDNARYFSNGWPGVWTPATDATLDTGVLVIGDGGCGCLWVEDED